MSDSFDHLDCKSIEGRLANPTFTGAFRDSIPCWIVIPKSQSTGRVSNEGNPCSPLHLGKSTKSVSGKSPGKDAVIRLEQLMLLFVSSLKLIAEVALFALAGRWLLGLLVGHKRDTNLFYQALSALTNPFTGVVRRITPSLVTDRHVPLVTFMLLFWIWVFALGEKVVICRANPLEALCQ